MGCGGQADMHRQGAARLGCDVCPGPGVGVGVGGYAAGCRQRWQWLGRGMPERLQEPTCRFVFPDWCWEVGYP